VKPTEQQTTSTGWRRFARRPSSASLVSVVVHAVAGVLLISALQMPAVFDDFLKVDRAAEPVRERVEFVAVTPAPVESLSTTSAVARPAPARQAPVVGSPEANAPLVAPREIPTELPPPAASTDTTVRGSVYGPLRGGTGPTRGVQPANDDPRVWPGDPEFIYAPKTEQQRLDSALYASLRKHMDSLATYSYVPNKFERGDWTVERNGQKYGIDQQFIRLGKFQIPTALLALLPLNRMQGNPIEMERSRNAAIIRADILMSAQAQMNEAQFRKAVQSIRARKERERAQAIVTPGPIVSPGEKPPPK
jgi:hypothetical protein